jgi:peptide chain release factor 1
VTDHRIGLTVHQLPDVLEGNLDALVEALLAAERTAELESLEA